MTTQSTQTTQNEMPPTAQPDDDAQRQAELHNEFVRKWIEANRLAARRLLPTWHRAVQRVALVGVLLSFGLLMGTQLLQRLHVQLPLEDNLHTILLGATVVCLAGYLILDAVATHRTRKRTRAQLAEEVAQGRLNHCIQCHYDTHATPGNTCPECGAPLRLEVRPAGSGEGSAG